MGFNSGFKGLKIKQKVTTAVAEASRSSKFTLSVFIHLIFFMGPCLCNPDTKTVTKNFKSRLENSVGTKLLCLK